LAACSRGAGQSSPTPTKRVASRAAIVPTITVKAPPPSNAPNPFVDQAEARLPTSGVPKSQWPAYRRIFRWLRGYPDKLRALGVEVSGFHADAAAPVIGIRNLNTRTASLVESSFEQANRGATVRLVSQGYAVAL
jgi:hypothetical protein